MKLKIMLVSLSLAMVVSFKAGATLDSCATRYDETTSICHVAFLYGSKCQFISYQVAIFVPSELMAKPKDCSTDHPLLSGICDEVLADPLCGDGFIINVCVSPGHPFHRAFHEQGFCDWMGGWLK